MSRALGDVKLRHILSQKPETYCVNLDGDSYVLVATDGLFDPAHNDKSTTAVIGNLIRDGYAAQHLVNYAMCTLANDNVTAILAKMEGTEDVLYDFGNNLNYSKTERTSSLAA
jgi:serine/threonine protein phosphatase PrpC